mgnify:CR=1 FL=1
MFRIAVTRFNHDTWRENHEYRIKKNLRGCVYGCPCPISGSILLYATLVVFEMNNSSNSIEGIGLIENRVHDSYHKIYENVSYNRYTYRGNDRIDRSQMNPNEEELFTIIEKIVFRGYGHVKRGFGISALPLKKIKDVTINDLSIEIFIKEMFERRRMKNNNKLQ